jgi:hypothetical protein
MGSIIWNTSSEEPKFKPEPGQFGFVGLQLWNDKYTPLIYTLEVQEDGSLAWTYFRSGKRYKTYQAAVRSAKKTGLQYGERDYANGSYYPTVDHCHLKIPYEGEVNLELLAKITKLRGLPLNF